MKIIAICLFALSAAVSTFAQYAPSPDAKIAEMKKVSIFEGKWSGTGWQQIGPKRENTTSTETVQKKLGGVAYLVEGRFADPDGAVKHETLAIMAYDDASKTIRMRTFLANGMSGDYEVKALGGNKFEWGFKTPAGTVRYSVTMTEDTWHEVGEFSRDGQTWNKTMEMTLKKVR